MPGDHSHGKSRRVRRSDTRLPDPTADRHHIGVGQDMSRPARASPLRRRRLLPCAEFPADIGVRALPGVPGWPGRLGGGCPKHHQGFPHSSFRSRGELSRHAAVSRNAWCVRPGALVSLRALGQIAPVRALIVGGSSGVGLALGEALAARGHALLLASSDARDLEAQASHLRLMHGVQVEIVAADATYPEEFLGKIVSAGKRFGAIQGLFFPIGASIDGDAGTLPTAEIRRLIDANLLTVMAVVGHFLPELLAANQGYIVGFGSVAAARGRRTNVIYAAAKRGLVSYFES